MLKIEIIISMLDLMFFKNDINYPNFYISSIKV